MVDAAFRLSMEEIFEVAFVILLPDARGIS